MYSQATIYAQFLKNGEQSVHCREVDAGFLELITETQRYSLTTETRGRRKAISTVSQVVQVSNDDDDDVDVDDDDNTDKTKVRMLLNRTFRACKLDHCQTPVA